MAPAAFGGHQGLKCRAERVIDIWMRAYLYFHIFIASRNYLTAWDFTDGR